jgi:UDP-2,3-diacylglucosamine pyrophosphatase LpxH
MLDAIILSDLHLGSDNCQAKLVCRMLERIAHKEITTQRLILNGDVFDSMDFRRLHKSHWKVLSLLRKLSDHLEIIWLAGNHDGSAEIISHLLGVQVRDDIVLESGSRRILILHGHVFDEFLDAHPILTWLGDCIYGFLQWIDRTHRLAKVAKRGSKTFLRCTQKIQERALDMARCKHCTAVCCGHTHLAVTHTEGPITYYNSGCWTELPCHYLTVEDGAIRVHTFQTEEAAVAAENMAEPVGAAL